MMSIDDASAAERLGRTPSVEERARKYERPASYFLRHAFFRLGPADAAAMRPAFGDFSRGEDDFALSFQAVTVTEKMMP